MVWIYVNYTGNYVIAVQCGLFLYCVLNTLCHKML